MTNAASCTCPANVIANGITKAVKLLLQRITYDSGTPVRLHSKKNEPISPHRMCHTPFNQQTQLSNFNKERTCFLLSKVLTNIHTDEGMIHQQTIHTGRSS